MNMNYLFPNTAGSYLWFRRAYDKCFQIFKGIGYIDYVEYFPKLFQEKKYCD